jgi:hypothetical protein
LVQTELLTLVAVAVHRLVTTEALTTVEQAVAVLLLLMQALRQHRLQVRLHCQAQFTLLLVAEALLSDAFR